jgi:hypothetical protein
MALKIMVLYKDAPLVYDVTRQEEDIYQLRLFGQNNNSGDGYVPEKVIIRKKGKIWVSDLENYPELVSSLTEELSQFRSGRR